MKNSFLFKISLFLVFLSISELGMSQSQRFVGANGHPITQVAYKNNFDLQFSALKSLRFNCYRVDIPVNRDGGVNIDGALKEFMAFAAKSPNIMLHPVLIVSIDTAELSNQQIYSNGYRAGKAFAERYGNISDYIEIGNELDNVSIKGSNPSGTSVDHYKLPYVTMIGHYLKGFSKAIKEIHPQKKIIIDISYVHWGFLEHLKNVGVEYDLIGLHWYSDMGNLYAWGNNKIDIVNTLYERFGKKVIVNEFNLRNGSKSNHDSSWLRDNLNSLKSNPNCIGIVFYELFDEPAFADKEGGGLYLPGEAYYGLVKFDEANNRPVIKDTYKDIELQIKTLRNLLF